MKLFLASASNTLSLMAQRLPKRGKGAKVIFIANASDNLSGDKWWIRNDRNAFKKMKCEVVDLDLRKIDSKEFSKSLKNASVVHFCGGSVLYLISLINKKRLKPALIRTIRRGKTIYSGTSAGSMITAADLKLSSYDGEDREYVKKMKDFSGLGLVDFLIIPHVNNVDFLGGNVRIIKQLHKNLQPLIFIDDNKAVLVEDDKIKIISVKST